MDSNDFPAPQDAFALTDFGFGTGVTDFGERVAVNNR